MRLRDILLAWAQAGSPDPGQYEVQLVPTAPQPAQAAPPAQPQPAPAAFGAPPVPFVPSQVAIPAPATPTTPGWPAPPAVPQATQGDAQFKAERQGRRLAEARLFYHEQLGAKKVVPAEEQAVVGRYLQAANDDDDHGLAQFAGGQPYSRLDALRAEFAARPPSVYTQELVGGHLPQGASVLGPQFGQDPMVALVQQAQAQAKAYAERANGTARGGAA